MTALEVRDVTVRLSGRTVLDDVSFTLSEGEFTGLIGANGAGKTTLFDICSGFLAPTAGRVRLGKRDVTDEPAHTRADLVAKMGQ